VLLATMISAGAVALTIHRGGTDDFGILAVPASPVRVWRTHVQGARHPDPAKPHNWRIRNDWRIIAL
jgi:hypothetical protein